MAETLVIGQLTAPCDKCHRSWDAAALNLVLHNLAQTREAGGGQTDIFGSGTRQWE